MKVLSYLELMIDVAKLNSKNIPNHLGYNSALELYSQTFYPRLITELFEGWEFVIERGNGRGVLFSPGRIWVLDWKYNFDNRLLLEYHKNNSLDYFQAPSPRTLNDFINQ